MRELREQMDILTHTIQNININNQSTYTYSLFYPIKYIAFNIIDTFINILCMSILIYVSIHSEFWFYSFMLSSIIIYRNIGGLILNINISLIMTIIGIIVMTHSFNLYTKRKNDIFNTCSIHDYSCMDDSFTNYDDTIHYLENTKLSNEINNITSMYIKIIKNTDRYKKFIEFKNAFIENYKDFQEIMFRVNNTIVYLNETIYFINKGNPAELGKSMGHYFQEKTNSVKQMYHRSMKWIDIVDYLSDMIEIKKKIN